jgi:dolichol-phosphate mannosyltransferase
MTSSYSNFEKKISIVIPMYNEIENVEPLIQEIAQAMASFDDYEILAIDDYSQDGTYQKLMQIRTLFPKLRVLQHVKNSGQSAGVVTGVRHAKFPWVATLDGDGQNDPADIPKLFEEILLHQKNNEMVVIAGHRSQRKDTWIKKSSSRIAYVVRSSILKDDCPDSGCGLKIFPKEIFLQLPHFNHIHRFLPALFKRQGIKVINLKVQHRPRLRGQSKYGVFNRLWVGIVDLFGVAWLMRRSCNAGVETTDA